MVPLLFERVRVPGVVGLILAGALIGPNGIGLLARSNTIILLGTVGLLYLMLQVGLELDLDDFRRYRRRSLIFGSLSFIIPCALGVSMGLGLGYSIASAALLGSVFASHTLLAFPVVVRLGITRDDAVTTTLGGTILTEIAALGILAFTAEASQGATIDIAFWLRLILPGLAYAALVLWGLPRIGRWFFRRVRADGSTEFIFVLSALFAVAYLAHAARMEPIIGALLVGLALNRLIPAQSALMNRIHFVGSALFIPFFLLWVGMLVDFRALDSIRSWSIALALAAGVIIAKGLAAFATGKVVGWNTARTLVSFGLSVPHAAGTLAVVLIGFEIGLFDQAEVNGVVLMILLTCVGGPWLVEKYGRQVALDAPPASEHMSPAPRRVLLPLANPATAGSLLDLAVLVRGRDSREPLYPFMIVNEEAPPAQIVEAEQVLASAVLHAAAAEIPVNPRTRVARNIAEGIAQGAAETRSSIIVIGWDGERSGSRAIFGNVLDQLLEQTRQMVLVSVLTHPLNTTQRLVLVVPPNADHHPGVPELLHVTAVTAAGLGASILGFVVRQGPEEIQRYFSTLSPQPAASWEGVGGWDELAGRLADILQPDDVLVMVSARRGTVHWSPRLERLPARLAAREPTSFIIGFPPELDAARPEVGEDRRLVPDRVVELRNEPWEEAVARLFIAAQVASPAAHDLTDAMIRETGAAPMELCPGVVLVHTRGRYVPGHLLVVGVSRDGLMVPGLTTAASLIFLLISSSDAVQEHLNVLSMLARLCSTQNGLKDWISGIDPSLPTDWME